MHRCYLEPDRWSADEPVLNPGESHHVARVLRAGPGEVIEVFDGHGRSAKATLRTTGRRIALTLGAPVIEPPPPVRVALYQALPKGVKLDWMIQKAVELGAAEFIAVQSEHAVARVAAADLERKLARWRDVAIAAAKQCGRNRLPELSFLPSVEAVGPRPDGCCWLLGLLGPEPRLLRDVLRDPAAAGCRSFGCWIGPEGDFSPGEIAYLRSRGALAASFGPAVFRTETAALFMLSAMHYEFGPEPG